ncbi:MAG: AsmA family protein [Solirubrobacterales bacterium]
MRTVLLIAVALVAVVVLAALVVPAMIDWSRYKGEIITRAEQATGRRVEIAGPVGLRLLPSPAFTAERLSIANPEGAEGTFATANKLAVRLRLLPLLTGKVAIDSLVVDRPEVTLARLPDGRPNWKFEPKAKEKAGEAKPETSPQASEGGLPIGEILVRNGKLSYAGGGAPIEATNIDARLEAAGPDGPFGAKGSMRLHGARVELEAGLDRVAEKHGSPAHANIRIPDAEARVNFSGLLTRLSEGESLHGNLSVSAADLNRLAVLAGTSLPLAPGTGAKIETTLTASTSEVSLANLAAMIGETRIGGQIVARLAEPTTVTVNLDAPSVDLDRLLASEPARQAPAPPPSAPKAPESGKAAESGTFSLPKDLKVDTALAVGTLQWRGQVAREARVDASLDQGMVVVNGATAQLPGGSVASLSGVLDAEGGHARFDGQLEARSDNARALLAWLGMDAGGVPEDRLRRLEASATIHATPPEWGLQDLTVRLDATTVRGSASARLAPRPAYGADLRADALNLDAYRPKPAAAEARSDPPPPPAGQPAESTRTPAPVQPGNPLRPLAEFDGTFKLAVDRLTLNGVAAEGARLAARLDNGLLAVSDLGVEIAGTRARGQGRIAGLATPSPRVEEAVVRLDSTQPARLFQFLGVQALADSRLGALAAQGRLEGDWNNIVLDGRAEAGGLVLTAQGSLASPLERPSYRLTVQASHENFAQLVRLWAPNYRPGGTVGPFALGAKVAGGPQTVDVTGLDLRAGATRLTGEAHVTLGGARPRLTADLAGGAIALDHFLPGEKTGLLQPGRAGALDPRIQMPPTLPAATGAASAGPGPWSHEPMDLAVLNAFDARVGLRAESVKWGAWTLEGAQTTLTVDNGTAAVDKLTGRLLGGTLNAGARLAHTGALALEFAIEGANLAQTKLGSGGIAVTQGRLNADAQLTSSGRSTYEMAQRLQGGGKLLVTDGVISGFDLPAVSKQLNNIENIGSLLGLVQSGLSGGNTRFSRLAGTFTADKGVVNSRDLKLDAEGGGATAETTLNLPPWTMQTSIAFHLANSSAPPLGVRLEGPIDNPRKIVDVNALQQFLVSRGLGRALSGKNGGDLLGGLLGGKQQPPAPGTTPQPGQPQPGKTKPKDVLKDLLKGLGGQ